MGMYNITDSTVSSDASLIWDKDKKSVEAAFDWTRANPQRDEISLKIKHPSFEKVLLTSFLQQHLWFQPIYILQDVTFIGEYEYDEKKLFDARLTVDYSPNPEQTVVLGTRVDDDSTASMYNYTYKIWAVHEASSLNLNTHGGFYWNPNGYSTGHYSEYRRSYLPLQTAEALARVDLLQNEMEIKVCNNTFIISAMPHITITLIQKAQILIYTNKKQRDILINFKPSA